MNDFFGPDGFLCDQIPGYEFREEQTIMADFITERLSSAENGVIEAGTGIGKTFAYLIPSIKFALENQKKICITTATKALQKQLIDKDLPLVKKIFEKLGDSFSYSICLGSGNYPCLHRLESAIARGEIKKNHAKDIEQLLNGSEKQQIFTRFDLRIPFDSWENICREGDACLSQMCRYFYRCSFQQARKEWQSADIIIMNHYLFFTNIASGGTYLPHSDIIIFDEAHSVEEISSSQLGFEISQKSINRIFSMIHGEKRRSGLADLTDNIPLRKSIVDLMNKTISEYNIFIEKIRAMLHDKYSLRIKNQLPFGEILETTLFELMKKTAEIEPMIKENESALFQFSMLMLRIKALAHGLRSFIRNEDSNYVYWAEKISDNELLNDIAVKGRAIDVSGILSEQVNGSHESVLYVSATLSVDNNFSYIIKRLGIDRARTISLKSPFDYKSQVVLYISPEIDDPTSPEYSVHAAGESSEIINIASGNCLMLFTSYRSLYDVKNHLAGSIDNTIYSQDEFSPSEAVDLFVNDTDSVLMGTDSFWQGIDLPGDLLRAVIIMRLPFMVPDSPVVEAKIEKIRASGQNPFYTYQIPEAVIKFKQGFGRLIRTKNDKGIAAVIDSRILSKPYGKIFINSIPECTVVYSIEELEKKYRKMLY